MEQLNGLVRSVTTPEFADVTFHEVMCKSALNHVPGASAMPFDWTINPYRGCTHACAYCLSPDTLILMGDGHSRPLRDISVGDEIIGTQMRGAYRRYIRTKVLAKWGTVKRAHRVTLADGTELVASGDHRFLSDRGWRHVTGRMGSAGRRPYLTTSNRLMGYGMATKAAGAESPVDGSTVKTVADLRVISIEDLGTDVDMIDITTGTGDFIANGVVSHNCFARGNARVPRARFGARLRLADHRQDQRGRGAREGAAPRNLDARSRDARHQHRSVPARRGAIPADARDRLARSPSPARRSRSSRRARCCAATCRCCRRRRHPFACRSRCR